MNRYFNKLNIAIVICLLLISGGCKKFLNQTPITEVGSDKVFADAPSAYKALVGVYSRLVGDAGYGIRVSLYYPVDNDETQGPTGAGDNDRRDLARYAATSGNAQITNPFNQIFQGIEYANICIDNIPKMAGYADSKQLQRMYGEALTLRAQFYFEGIRNWGDLPAHFTPAYSLATGNPFPSRTSTDSLYDHVLADLKIAEEIVPWRNDISSIGDQTDERITKGVVKGLRARIALFRGGYSLRQTGGMQRSADYATFYQIARDECNDIITSGQHALNPSYKSLWKDQVGAHAVTDPQGELMMQASAIGLTGSEDTKLGYYDGPTVSVTVGTTTTTYGNKSINALPSYFYLFDSTDQRRDVTNCAYNLTWVADNSPLRKVGQAVTAINDGKYRRDWTSPFIPASSYGTQYLSLKWQLLRYADVLLMFAEAENEINGPTAAAYNAINMVRRRGYGKPVSAPDATVDIAAGLSKAAFFGAVVRERALEFGGEGIRKYDLIRWNLLATALTESKANMTRMSTNAAMVNPSYMAGYPAYCLTTALPAAMYYVTNTTSDDNNIGGLWANSLYKTAPAATPSGTTKVNWVTSAIAAAGTTSPVGRYATGFSSGKGELLPIPQPARDANPNLTQNPGY